MKKKIYSFLWVDQFDAFTLSKHLELVKGNLLLVSEIPLDQVFKLSVLEFESTSFNKLLKIVDVDDLGLLMLYTVKKSIQKHVILLLISELIVVLDLEALHKLAELIFIEFLTVFGVTGHDFIKRSQESLFGLLIINSHDRSFK